jgi:hypothetical protein
MKTTSAECVAHELWSVFSLLGLPKILQSDNGPEFVNDILRALVTMTGIEHRFISPYNPRADGKVERSIGTVMSTIKKMLHGTDNHWPLFVPFAQLSFNCKVASLTQSTPFSLMFGRALNEPRDYTGVPSGSDPVLVDVADWKQYQEKMIAIIFPAISDRIDKSKKRMVAALNKHRRQLMPGAIPNGAIVMIIDHTRGNKFEPKYVGPYTVVRRSRNGAYVLKDESDGEILDRRVPPDQLKLVSRKPRAVDVANKTYVVQSIVGHRGVPGNYEYDVKWKDHNTRTWEHQSAFLDTDCIKDYWKSAVPASSGSRSGKKNRA